MRVTRLDSAHIICRDSILMDGGRQDTGTMIGCFAYLVEYGEELLLVDTGIEDLDTVNRTKSSKDRWSREGTETTILEDLNRWGIAPEQIDRVFLTHSHYDHISGVKHFENATVYLSEKEYAYLTGGENPHRPYLDDIVSFLEAKKVDGKLVLVGDTYLEGDIQCTLVGGHTPGSMLVQVGNCLFTGDAVFLLRNIRDNMPIGFCADPEAACRAVEICRQHNGVVFTGHDKTCPQNWS